MIDMAFLESKFDKVMVHIDLDEYDNPWDGNSANEMNIEGSTSYILKNWLQTLTLFPKLNQYFGTIACQQVSFRLSTGRK